MKRQSYALIAVATLAVGGSALAVGIGGTLYVQTNGVTLKKSTSPTAASVATFRSGDAIVWQGADAKNKKWHKVKSAQGKVGYVLRTSLGTTPPPKGISAVSGGSDTQGFATSGAATKMVSDGVFAYACKKPGGCDAARDITAAEAVSFQTKPGELEAHAEKQGLTFPQGAGR
jgi:hypothetical protein